MSDQPNPHWTEGLLSTPFSLFQVGPEVPFQDAGQENDANEHVDVIPNELPDVNAGQVDAIDVIANDHAAVNKDEHADRPLNAAETQLRVQERAIDDDSDEEGKAEDVLSGKPKGLIEPPQSQPTPESRQACPAREGDAPDAAEIQPIGQLKDIGDTSLPEGLIEPATPLSELNSPNELADVNAGQVDAIDVIANEHADVNEDDHADGPPNAAETQLGVQERAVDDDANEEGKAEEVSSGKPEIGQAASLTDASISGSRDGTITDRTEREEFTYKPEELQPLTQDGAGAEDSPHPPQSRQACPVQLGQENTTENDAIDPNANEHANANEERNIISEVGKVVFGKPEIGQTSSSSLGSRDGTITDGTESEEVTHKPEEPHPLTRDGGSAVSRKPSKDSRILDSQQTPQFRQACPAREGDALDAAETQPVGQLKDIEDTSLPEGPIELKRQPDNLPSGFEWTTCDMNSHDMCSEVYKFFQENYPDEVYVGEEFKVIYPMKFLKWALCPPGYYRSWHIGIRAKKSKKLTGFISGVPARIRVRDEVVKMVQINFLCVHKKLRSKRLAPVLIKELTRRVHLENVWQAVYSVDDLLPTSLQRPASVTSCKYWLRMLNPKKLIDAEFSSLSLGATISMTVKLFKLPEAPITRGFREMNQHDVCDVTLLLKNYLRQFEVATDFGINDVEHWLLPREDVIYSYVVASPETYQITDFCSFYNLPITIVGNPKYTTLKCAYSFYNVTTSTTLPQLMNDALIASKQKDFDLFYALDVMHNESFLKELKFEKADSKMHYYLHNYGLRSALKPSELGLVFW